MLSEDGHRVISPCVCPPSRNSVVKWLRQKISKIKLSKTTEVNCENVQESLVSSQTMSEKEKIIKNVNLSQQLSFTLDAEDRNEEENNLLDVSKRNEEETYLSDVLKKNCDSSVLSNTSLNDSSTLINSDLDLSCTATGPTPAPILSSFKDKSQECSLSRAKISRKRKLRFSTEDQDLQSDSPLHDTQTLDEQCRTSKRPREDQEDINSSTPVRKGSQNIINLSYTPIASQKSPEEDKFIKKTTLMKRISTDTEQKLRRNILDSQIQVSLNY